MLGLAYPGGPALERLAREGDPGRVLVPDRRRGPGLDFSFAGLKTALLYNVRDLGDGAQARRADLAAAYQRAIVEALALKVERGSRETGLERLAIGGGVAANGPLRERMAGLGVELHVPERALCTDNAAEPIIAALSVHSSFGGMFSSTPARPSARAAARWPPRRRRSPGASSPVRAGARSTRASSASTIAAW